MTNPVNNSSRISSGQPTAVSNQPVRGDKASPEAKQPSQVSTADASTESSRLQQLREKINSTPDVDMNRVEQIKQALAEGRLPLDSQRVAQKFADLEGLLGD